MRVVAGGQTGVDRGALEAALELGVPCGGWCPAGRRAEDGSIPATFPVVELPGAGYPERTCKNVLDSDGTLIIFCGQLTGGSLLTVKLAQDHSKPLLLLDAERLTNAAAASEVVDFVRTRHIDTLNVAGPRASDWPAGEAWAREVMHCALTCLHGAGVRS